MKFSLVLTFVLILQIDLISQQWTFQEKQSSFDGKIKSAQVKGVGTDNIYRNPYMVINYFENTNKLNIYFGNAGYSGCDSKLVYLIIDANSSDIKTYYGKSNNSNDTWFIGSDKNVKFLDDWTEYDWDWAEYLYLRSLLDNLKEGSKLEVRLVSDCNKNDLTFSLKGSFNAINSVISDWIKYKEQYFKDQEEREAKEKERQEREEALRKLQQEEREEAEKERKRIEDSLKLVRIEEEKIAKEMMIANRPNLISELKVKYSESNFKVISVKQNGKFYKIRKGHIPYLFFRSEDDAIAVILLMESSVASTSASSFDSLYANRFLLC
jgi:hypothetical protein